MWCVRRPCAAFPGGMNDQVELTMTPEQEATWGASANCSGRELSEWMWDALDSAVTGRHRETLELEADHRRHAEIENAIRDLKFGVGLNDLPSGRFAANAAWLAVQVMAHTLARWTARFGLGEQMVTTKTLRRRFFTLAGRLTRSARRLTLHLPWRWHCLPERASRRTLIYLRRCESGLRRGAAQSSSSVSSFSYRSCYS